MSTDVVSNSALAVALRQAGGRMEAVHEAQASAARAVAVGWAGPTRRHFDRQWGRQCVLVLHLVAQARRLAAELEAG